MSVRLVKCTCCDITWSSHPDFLNHLAAIERQRERIAQEIEAQLTDWLSLSGARGDGPPGLGSAEWAVQRAYESCAIIARGRA